MTTLLHVANIFGMGDAMATIIALQAERNACQHAMNKDMTVSAVGIFYSFNDTQMYGNARIKNCVAADIKCNYSTNYG